MDPITQSPLASGSQMPPVPHEDVRKPGIGPVAGTAIIILLLIAGGLYFWGAKLNKEAIENPPPFIPSNDELRVQTDANVGLPPQSASDEAAAIEADLDAINLEAIDAENNAELQSI